MNSRRSFLRNASALTAASFAPRSALLAQAAPAQDGAETAITANRDYWNDFPGYLTRKVNAARVRRTAELEKLTSSAAVKERNSFVVQKVWELIGGPVEKTALDPVITGVIRRKGYRIEKVIFESQPEFYVTAHLYLPESSQRVPGILAPLGHAEEGKAYQSYQTVFQNLAKKGYAVLAWDPPGQGERLQYLDASKKASRFGPTGEHDQFGWPALLTGSSTTQFEVMDGIRALDYLLSRSEVDTARIGCCGHSGGGTQTMYLCALEPRINVACVIEGHTENVAGADYRPPGAFADAEQNLIGGLASGVDRGDLLIAFAPKPLLICYTPNDAGTTYSPHYIQGNKEIFADLQRIYGLSDQKEKVRLSNSILPHDYDFYQRRSTYEWFNKWLKGGQGDAEEEAFEYAPAETLWCTTTGQVLTSLGGRPAYQITSDRLARLQSTEQKQELTSTKAQEDLRRVLALPKESQAPQGQLFSRRTLHKDLIVEDFDFESESGVRVPGWFLKPAGGDRKYPVVLVIQDHGKDQLFDEIDLAHGLVKAGHAVCSVDLRGCGITSPRLPSEGPLFYGKAINMAYSLVSLSLGAPIIGQQTFDLLRTVDYLHGRSDVDTGRIGLFANGHSGLAAMFGTALDRRIRSLFVHRALVSLQSVVRTEEYDFPLQSVSFGMLKHFDLPELCASAIAPRPIWLVNTVDAQGHTLSLSEMNEQYAFARRGNQFTVLVEPAAGINESVFSWTQKMNA